jgi:quercetin dioxygenase-like cupin family protein
MNIQRNGSTPSIRGAQEWFAGVVRIDHLFFAPEPARASGAAVTFEPGARTAWHEHPLGQTLIVTAGSGFVQKWGEPAQAIHPGDVVWIGPGEKHWHGAAQTTAMTHVAIQEAHEGSVGTWHEQVSEAQYRGATCMSRKARHSTGGRLPRSAKVAPLFRP